MAGEKERSTIEGAIVDAELFLKYRMPDRAITRLRDAVAQYPHNPDLRWQLAEICLDQHMTKAAAEQLIELANIYVESYQFDLARSALLRTKEIYPNAPQVNTWLASIDQQQRKQEQDSRPQYRLQAALAGDLRHISLFDIIQAVEKSRITGVIYVESGDTEGSIYFNNGLIADAIIGNLRGKAAFKRVAEVDKGIFELEKSPVEYQASIASTSNAQLILEIFAEDDQQD